MRVYLAPMEGVVDSIMRKILTQVGGFDYCVTEFVRVTDMLYPNHVFYKYCPELKQGAQTNSGTPVWVQFLGSNAECIGENAVRAIHLGATHIDLNFGCPAKTVNRHDGGATLLKDPNRVYQVVHGVRKVVPPEIPVSAKIRLGFEDKSLALENSIAANEGGAHTLVVHARTKKEGYKPPAHWEWLAKIREVVKIPVVANGDIWSLADYKRCREITGCDDVMIGRGAVSMPDLALQIKTNGEKYPEYQWSDIALLMREMFTLCWQHDKKGKYPVARLKQWLKMLMRNYPEAKDFFNEVKTITDPDAVAHHLDTLTSIKC